MASDHTIRASDRDRDAVVDTLRDAYVAGRLTLDEFNERTAACYHSRTWGDLRELTADLPVQPVLGADIPGRDAPQVPMLPPVRPLPVPPPGHVPPRPAQRAHPGVLIPFVMFWFLVAIVTHSPVAIAFPVVILVVSILLNGIFRRR
jgi:hypothetical protein